MARSGLRDPLDRFRWVVTVPGFSKLGFTQMGTPKYNISPREYAEMGAHLNPKSIIDRVAYSPIVLSTGVTNDTSFARWASSPWDLVQNNAAFNSSSTTLASLATGVGLEIALGAATTNGGAKIVKSNSDYPFIYRKQITIEHVNRSGDTVCVYTLYNAYPISYQPASDFDAASDEFSIASLTLGYEGFDVKYMGVAGTINNLVTQKLF